MEALMRGFSTVSGSDVSPKAIADSQKNIDWLKGQWKTISGQAKLEVGDVQSLVDRLPAHSIDAIVTEPFLGPPQTGHASPAELENSSNDLLALYFTSFQQFKKILRPGGVIIFVVPRFKKTNGWLTISERLVPKLVQLGFVPQALLPPSLHSEPFLLYHRPDQHVAREIWKFVIPNN